MALLHHSAARVVFIIKQCRYRFSVATQFNHRLTSVRSDHELGGNGGLELEARGAVRAVDVGHGVALARVQHQDLRRLRELADVPPFHLREKKL